MSVYYCRACYGRKVWCRRCKTRHCDCSWNRCPKQGKKPDAGGERRGNMKLKQPGGAASGTGEPE